jgi:hypothetical protein
MPFSAWGDHDHEAGNPDCGACWSWLPRPCEEPDCKGLVHAESGGHYEPPSYRCDACGSTREQGVQLADVFMADIEHEHDHKHPGRYTDDTDPPPAP